jgi:hypothetical protein
MSKMIRRGLLVVAGLTGLTVGTAAATGIEKPPSVPPEVEEARQACPTVVGPCYGYHPTRWRALPCCVPDALPPARLDPAGRGMRDRGAADATRAATRTPAAKAAQWPAYPAVGRPPAPRLLPPTEDRPTRAWVSGEDQ